jgi:undecaprenyl diphosphate synthase
MAHAVRTVVSGVEDGTLKVSDVTQQLLSSCLYTSASPNPELLIRTSGEVRLSDYMLWQVGTGEWKDVQFDLFVFLITDTCFSIHHFTRVVFCSSNNV